MRLYRKPACALLLLTACFTPEDEAGGSGDDESTGATTGTPSTTASSSDPSTSGPTTTPTATDPTATDPSTTAPTATDPTLTTVGDSSSTGDATDPTDPSDPTDPTDSTSTGDESTSTGSSCDPGTLDCGSGACDINSDEDPMNCGECGHDCLGGECSDGECEPVSLLFDSSVTALAVDEDAIYFARTTSLQRMNQAPGATPSALIADIGAPTAGTRDVGVDNTHVYVGGGSNGGNGFIVRIPKAGGNTIDLFEPEDVSQASGPSLLAIGPARLFWRASSNVIGAGGYYVRGVNKDGVGNSTLYLDDSDDLVSRIAGNSNFVYFHVIGGASALFRRAVGIGGQSTVLTNISATTGLVATNDGVFVAGNDTNTGMNTLWSMDQAGDNPTILIDASSPFFDDGSGLFVSEDQLVWADIEAGGNAVRTMGTDGSNPRTVREGIVGTNQFNQFDEGSLTADSEAYFFYDDSQIWMLAK